MSRDYSLLSGLIDGGAPYNVAPQQYVVGRPYDSEGSMALLYLQGLGGNSRSSFADPATQPARYNFFRRLVSAGIPVICHDMSYPRLQNGTTPIDDYDAWANTVERTTFHRIRTDICPRYGWRTDRMHVMGSSAGCHESLIIAQANTDRIGAFILTKPTVDTEGIRALQVLSGGLGATTEASDTGNKNTVNIAWGKTYNSYALRDSDGMYYGDPLLYDTGPLTGQVAGPLDVRNMAIIRDQIVAPGNFTGYYYSTADTTIQGSTGSGVTEWCPTTGVTATVVSTTVDHDDDAYFDAFPILEIIDGLRATERLYPVAA